MKTIIPRKSRRHARPRARSGVTRAGARDVAEGRRDRPSARPVSKEFRKALARGGIAVDAKVARALGYSQRATKVFMPVGAKEPVYADYVEHFPPDERMSGQPAAG
jgi:hypothetical protein